MNESLRISMILLAIITFLFVVRKVKYNTIHIKDTIIWVLWTALVMILAIFPQILSYISHLLGFELVSNSIFFFICGFLYITVFLQAQKVSLQQERIKNLSQEIGLLRKEIEDKENNY